MRNQTELVQLLDRYRIGLSQRLVIGLSIADDFSAVDGTLMLAEGRGKWLRPRWFEYDRIEIPESISRACVAIRNSKSIDACEFIQVRADLTRQLPEIITRLTRLSGKAAKRLLVTCVDDPGIWPTDFDGHRCYDSFCDATLLAETSGMTIVSSLPERDLAAGGRGQPLYPLAKWLLFADRSERVANTISVVMESGNDFTLTFLPPSDGLDNEVPLIKRVHVGSPEVEAEIIGFADKLASADGEVAVEVVVAEDDAVAIKLFEQIQKDNATVKKWCGEEKNCDTGHLPSMAVATLGLMHLDQMPATLPWLTSCEYPRILGRLTPGRPANWRQVIMEMADYHPPAMKLREAV